MLGVPGRGRRAACVTRRTPCREAPAVASPDGEGTPASRLAASMAQKRTFVCALPAPHSARVARRWRNSACLAGIAVNPFAAANCC